MEINNNDLELFYLKNIKKPDFLSGFFIQFIGLAWSPLFL